MNRFCLTLPLFMTAAMTGSSLAIAQSCSAEGTPASCSVPGTLTLTAISVVSLQMSSTSTSLASPTAADFKAGFNASTGPTLTIAANVPWTVHIRSGSGLWSATNTSGGAPARLNKPATDLGWSTASNGVFSPLSVVDADLATGAASGGNVRTIFFRTAYNWTLDAPGVYTLVVILTLTSP
jgi:hypothetical protein